MVNLKIAPFNLSDEDIKWVETTLHSMTLEEKIGHLFCPVGLNSDRNVLGDLINKYKPAGMMFRPGTSIEVQETHRFLQQTSKIPMLIASNLENGGNGSSIQGTEFGTPMLVAASAQISHAENLGRVCATEGKALGCNWAFAPVVDLDLNFHNPITNTRTFGSNPETVKVMGSAYVSTLQKYGMAAAIKHFPGDGTDFRDQHIALTFNHLSYEEWDKTYGDIYRTMISSGTLSVMTGHIGFPAYEKILNPTISAKEILPASLSPQLLQGLLRNKLGFNGVIVTDATPMVGFTSVMPRHLAVPKAIAAGCDIFLFNKDLAEDFRFMQQGIESGILSITRVDEAITRTLAMKAALKLHHLLPNERVPAAAELEVIGCAQHQEWAAICADDGITLVKDTEHLLPISNKKHSRILLFTLSDDGDFFGNKQSIFDHAVNKLTNEGFHITQFDPSKFTMRDMSLTINSIKNSYDLVLYFSNIKPASNKTSLRLNWASPMGINAPWFTSEIPTVFVSFGSPYHLVDVPRVTTYINAYTGNLIVIEKTIRKLIGKSKFKGKNPVDPFCGLWDAKI